MTLKFTQGSSTPRIAQPRAQSPRIEAIGVRAFWWCMIFSENRFPLFRIML
jgi:hypothetical protein